MKKQGPDSSSPCLLVGLAGAYRADPGPPVAPVVGGYEGVGVLTREPDMAGKVRRSCLEVTPTANRKGRRTAERWPVRVLAGLKQDSRALEVCLARALHDVPGLGEDAAAHVLGQ